MMQHGAHSGERNSPPKQSSIHRGGRQQQRRGENAQNLLSFRLPPRTNFQNPTPRRSGKRNQMSSAQMKDHLNAQYRFVLKPTGDYTVHFADPDVYFNWQDILQIVVPTSSALKNSATQSTITPESHSYDISCPICLCWPSAPRMTQCGHIFCYPCLLHYMELAEGTKWRKCPVCGDSIHAKDVKSVKWFDARQSAKETKESNPTCHDAPIITDNKNGTQDEWITMRLMARPEMTMLALPRSSTWPLESGMIEHVTPWHFTPDALTFSKFMLSTRQNMLDELERDERELITEMTSMEQDPLGQSFIKRALEKIQEQKEKAKLLEPDWVQSSKLSAQRRIDECMFPEHQETEPSTTTPTSLNSPASSSSSTLATAAEHQDNQKEQRNNDNEHNQVEEQEQEQEKFNDEVPEFYRNVKSQITMNQNYVNLEKTQINPKPKSTSNVTTATTTTTTNATTSSKPPGAPGYDGKSSTKNNRMNSIPTSSTTYYFYQAASGQPIFLHPLDIRILRAEFESYSAFPDIIHVQVRGQEDGGVDKELRRRYKYLGHLPEAADVTFVETDLSTIVKPKTIKDYSVQLKQRAQRRKEKIKKDNKAKSKAQAREHREQAIMLNEATATVTATSSSSNVNPLSASVADVSAPIIMEMETSPPLNPNNNEEGDTFAPANNNNQRQTVWGTPAINSVVNEPEDDMGAWHDFEDVVQGTSSGRNKNNRRNSNNNNTNSTSGRGKNNKRNNKKVVINLAG